MFLNPQRESRRGLEGEEKDWSRKGLTRKKREDILIKRSKEPKAD
jgi:hypothetical protein